MSTVAEAPKPKTLPKLAIRPFIVEDPGDLGLSKNGLVIHEGTTHGEQITCSDSGSGLKYITGLDEFSPAVMRLEEKERKAKIKEIRKDVIYLEQMIGSNPMSPKDAELDPAEFWAKVKTVHPQNKTFWGKRENELRLTNEAVMLDAANNPYDLIKLRVLEAGGYDSVAPSYEVARKTNKFKWYLDRFEKTVSDKVTLSKLKNKAIEQMQKLFENDAEKLRFVLKNILIDCVGYKPSTPLDSLYEDADAYINGRGEEKTMKYAAKKFLDTIDMKIEDLKLIAIVKDACIYNFLIAKPDGIWHADSHTRCGANVAEVVAYLNSPMNERVLESVQKSVELEWQK
jgi:hypothetical protein